MIRLHLVITSLLLSFGIASSMPDIQFIRLDTENSDLSHNYVKAITKDESGLIWIGTSNGLNIYDGQNINVLYQGDHGLTSSYIIELGIDKSNTLWVRTRDTTQFYDKNTDSFITDKTDVFEKYQKEEKDISSYLINDLMLTDKYPGLNPVCTSCDAEGNIWIGTNDGLYVFNHDDKTIEHINNTGEDFSLLDNRVTTIYAGHSGEIWLGTRSGVFYSDRISCLFRKVTSIDGESLKNSYINTFAQDNNGKIWISTEISGLYIYDILTTGIKKFHHSALQRRCLGIRLFDNYLWTINDNGITRINIETQESKSFFETTDHRRLGYSRDVCRSKDGKIFVGTNAGLFTLDSETDELIDIKDFNDINIESLFCDSSNNIWLCTSSKGLYRINPTDMTYQHFEYENNVDGTIPASRILSAHETSDGTMWFSTFGKGICCLNKSNNTFTVYNSSTLSNPNFKDICYSILNDNSGNLWIYTNRGIMRFNHQTLSINRFTTKDGLLNNENAPAANLHIGNDDIFYGSADGFTIFNAERLNKELYNAKLFVRNVYANKHKVSFNNRELSLESNENSLVFEIGALGLSLRNLDIDYRLVGYSNKWHPLGNDENKIVYTNLPYGKYTLEVRDNITGSIIELPLEIKVPLYLSWWAKLIYCLSLIGLILLTVKITRMRDMRKNKAILDEIKFKQEKDLLEEKVTFLSNIVHEIKTPLTLIKSPVNAIGRQFPDDRQVQENIKVINNSTNHLKELTNEMLEYLRIERKGYILENKILDICSIIEETACNFAERAKELNIDFQYNTSEEPIYIEADISSLRKILNNLIGNAFKYCNTKVSIQVKMQNDTDCCTIIFINDGETIPVEWQERIFKPFMRTDGVKLNETDGIGLGLPLARSLAELNQGTLSLNTESELTEFVLSFPCVSNPAEDIIQKDTDTYTILIAEDNVDLRSYLTSQLGKDYNVVTVGDGASAINCMHKHNIDILISDVSMPIMSGVELCQKVRANFDISHVMIIIISGKNDLDVKISSIEKGANLYIEKPLDIEYLKACIKNLLEHRKLLQKTLCNTLIAENDDNFNLNKSDRDFIAKIEQEVMKNLSNPAYSVTQLEDTLCMSNATLLRKFKRLLNTTPNSYIRTKRLIMAAKMLREGESRISEVSFACGFNTTTYFTKCFHDYYGCTPNTYIQNQSK